MHFDFLVLCTGFSYKNPIKSENSITLRDRTNDLYAFYEKVKNAKSVLIAGAGYVGCEIAAELAVAYGAEKKIGICLKGEKLLHQLPQRFGEVTEEFFRNNKVHVHRNVPYSESTMK